MLISFFFFVEEGVEDNEFMDELVREGTDAPDAAGNVIGPAWDHSDTQQETDETYQAQGDVIQDPKYMTCSYKNLIYM